MHGYDREAAVVPLLNLTIGSLFWGRGDRLTCSGSGKSDGPTCPGWGRRDTDSGPEFEMIITSEVETMMKQ